LPYSEVAEGLMFGKGLIAKIHVGFFMFNRPGLPSSAAVERLSISAAARSAAWQCSPR
jgi:hypothetical protein